MLQKLQFLIKRLIIKQVSKKQPAHFLRKTAHIQHTLPLAHLLLNHNMIGFATGIHIVTRHAAHFHTFLVYFFLYTVLFCCVFWKVDVLCL